MRKHTLHFLMIWLAANLANAQTGQQISLTSNSVLVQSIPDTLVITSNDLSNLTWGVPPYQYNLYTLTNDMFIYITTVEVDSLADLKDFTTIYTPEGNGTFKVIVYDSLKSDFLFGTHDYEILMPNLIIKDTVLCENTFTHINVVHNFQINDSLIFTLLLYNKNTGLWDTASVSDSNSFLIKTPDLSEEEQYDDEILEYKCLINFNNFVQATDIVSIRVINVGIPLISSYDYICNATNQ